MLAVGLLGAGPWAASVHAPAFAAGPETHLAGVWSRTTAAAEALAATHGVTAFASVDALLDACDAVAIAVPPTVQPDLAVRAAKAGKAVLLEKPVGVTVDDAERVADAVGEAGVGSLVVLTYRFRPHVEAFLAEARTTTWLGGRACFLSGAFLGGPYHRSPWRAAHGALLDVGPHVLDLIDAALGPIVDVRARGTEWVSLVCEHESGAVSDVAVSCSVAITPSRTEVELFGPEGDLAVDARAAERDVWVAAIRQRFAAVAADPTATNDMDVTRGLHLQRVIARAIGGTPPS